MSETVLIVPDTHRPFHDRKGWALFMKVARVIKPKHLVIIGDFADCYSVSDHDKDPEHAMRFAEEIADVNDGLDELDSLGATTKLYVEGNHEDRLRRYVMKHPELKNVLTVPQLFHLTQRRWKYTPYKQHTNLGKVYFTHDVGVASRSAVFRSLDLYQHSIVTGHCFDDATEILTRDGWKTHETLQEGDDVMTLNRVTNQMEWNPIEQVHRYAHDGEMVRVQSRSVDLLVTPQHGLWVQGQTGRWKEMTAEAACGSQRGFRMAGTLDAPPTALTDAQIRVLAWIMTDGSYAEDGTVRIAQSDVPDGRLAQLYADLDAAGLAYSAVRRYNAGKAQNGTHRNYDAWRIGIRGAMHTPWIGASLTRGDKMPCGELRRLNGAQAGVFVRAYLRGDGSKNVGARNSWQSSSVRKEHMDFLQAMCAISGYRSVLHPYADKGNRPLYRMTINSRETAQVQKGSWSTVQHTGTVWCVTVANGTLLVRRGGKPTVTLNTHRLMYVVEGTALGNEPKVAASFGWLGDVEKIDYMTKAKARAGWALGFGVGTLNPKTGFMYLSPVPILPDYSCCYNGTVYR